MPRSRHYRITLADALSAHEGALLTGGRIGIINLDSVESAIGRPYSGYHRSIARKSAALTQSVTNNHGFADGNKRTALILVDMLIARSGYELVAADDGGDLETEIEDMILAVEAGMPFEQIVQWFNAHIRRAE